MTVAFKAPLQSAVTNTAYVSKIADDIKTGKFTLANPSEGSTIVSVQKSLNEIFENQGYTEGDVNAKNYASTNYVSNGDSQKQAIEKLDNQAFLDETNLNNHIASNTAHAAIDITYDNTDSGLTATNAKTAIDEVEQRVEDIETSIGQPDGICPLDNGGKVSSIYLPSYVDDVLEYADLASFPVTGETGKIYVALDTGKTYRWSGSSYQEVSPSDVNSVNGKVGIVTLDKTDIGLSNVTNDSQLKRASADFNTFTEKPLPVENDIVLIEDSEDSFSKKKVLLTNLLGGGGGGGGSFAWELNGLSSPIESIFNNQISVLDFDYESNHEIFASLVVPDSYKAGDQILIKGMKYFTSATTGNVFFKTETTLIKAGQDMTSLPTAHVSSNTEFTLTGAANILRDIGDLDLTDISGEIDSVAVDIGDILLVRFLRDNSNESIGANQDCRLLKYSASVKFDG